VSRCEQHAPATKPSACIHVDRKLLLCTPPTSYSPARAATLEGFAMHSKSMYLLSNPGNLLDGAPSVATVATTLPSNISCDRDSASSASSSYNARRQAARGVSCAGANFSLMVLPRTLNRWPLGTSAWSTAGWAALTRRGYDSTSLRDVGDTCSVLLLEYFPAALLHAY
jgi:hypothetical protein